MTVQKQLLEYILALEGFANLAPGENLDMVVQFYLKCI